jgi:hypothetical protein
MANPMEAAEAPELISATTVWSLFATIVILAAGFISSRQLLPASASKKTRFLFIWHATDALIHFVLEGGYLWNCFFSRSTLVASGLTGSEYLPRDVFFLGDQENVYGASYGTSPMSALWREYARADKRWAGTDLTVISLELLTVFIAGPLAVWVCYCIKNKRSEATFWMIVLATGELYGGWMTFVPVRLLHCNVHCRQSILTCDAGMAEWKPQSEHVELDVHVVVPLLL